MATITQPDAYGLQIRKGHKHIAYVTFSSGEAYGKAQRIAEQADCDYAPKTPKRRKTNTSVPGLSYSINHRKGKRYGIYQLRYRGQVMGIGCGRVDDVNHEKLKADALRVALMILKDEENDTE